MSGILNITFIDILDILLVGLLIFQIYKIVRNSTVVNIFLGIIALYVLWLVVDILDMELLKSILGQILGVGIIALIVIFQPEIRRFLLHIGTKYVKNGKLTLAIFAHHSNETNRENLEEILLACQRMSDSFTGALIVLTQDSPLREIAETGDIIDTNINRRLIENIFFKNSPLHDGAMVIANNRILAARCTLPITEREDIPPQFGMRHRAAIGLTEQTDAIVLVVSEETGRVSMVKDGNINVMTSISELRDSLNKIAKQKEQTDKKDR